MNPPSLTTRFTSQHQQAMPAFGARKAKQTRFASYAPNTTLPVVTSSPMDATTAARVRSRQYWSV